MNPFVKLIVNSIMTLIKRAWRMVKLAEIESEVIEAKKESENAIKESNRAVDDFERQYKLFLDNEAKESTRDKDDNKDSES